MPEDQDVLEMDADPLAVVTSMGELAEDAAELEDLHHQQARVGCRYRHGLFPPAQSGSVQIS